MARAASRPARHVIAAATLWCLAAPVLAQPRRLDLSGYALVFDEDFTALSVSPHGPSTRWIAHTPWNGDFGEARFVDPRPDYPFQRANGTFRIVLRKTPDGRWESGLLASVDARGRGFALQYGYFEIRAKLPDSPGMWPAFWLDSVVPQPSPDASVEFDIFEHYGKWPGAFNTTVTVWPKAKGEKPPSHMKIALVPDGTLSQAFHTYGGEVTPAWTIFYFDGVEYWRLPTPPEHKHPLMILVDLGLGGGWPIDQAVSPSYFEITYIRAYAPKGRIQNLSR